MPIDSIYLLLATLALDSIRSQLTPSNVALELFGNLAGLFEEIRKIEMAYFLARYEAVKRTKTIQIVQERATAGKLNYYLETSMEVMDRLTAIG